MLHVVSSRLVYPPEKKETNVSQLRNTTCPMITCKYYKYFDKSERAHSSFLDKTWKGRIGCHISCLTDNVVYMINCLKWWSQYVGETKWCLRARMYEHIWSIETFNTSKTTIQFLSTSTGVVLDWLNWTSKYWKHSKVTLPLMKPPNSDAKERNGGFWIWECWIPWESMQLCRVLTPTY